MGTSSIKLISRPPKANLQFASIQREIGKQLQAVGRQHVQERQKVVSDFDHKPEFGFEVKVTGGQVTMTVKVTNPNEPVSDSFSIGDLWTSLDKTGVRPHIIRAKNAQRLSFVTGYQSHTRPIGRSGGPGQATGNRVFRKQVNHPGYPPRKFSEVINKRLRRQFTQAVDRGIRIGGKRR